MYGLQNYEIFLKRKFLNDLDMRGEPEMAWKIFIGI